MDEFQGTVLGSWRSMSVKARSFLVGLFLVSIVAVLVFAGIVSSSSMAFPAGPLSSGQIMVFILCIFVIAWSALDTLFRRMLGSSDLCPNMESRAILRSGAEFSGYLLLFFICDRTTLFPRMEKWYSADSFWFLWIALVAISFCTFTKAKTPSSLVVNGQHTPENFHVPPLARNQTEEWKGWMQVLFLWYHYFHNVSIYNSIRLFIAAYVWMTGFGNFSYYYVRKDFSLSRFCEMQWRLNFLVAATCLMLGNEYMLYYICPLHTLFTLIIYGSLWYYQELNSTNRGIIIKASILFVLCFCLWDVSEQFFCILWTPLKWLVRYDDPYRPQREVMSEWYFRTFLDHYVWIYGMLFAYCHPRYDSYLKRIDEMPKYISWLIKSIIVTISLFIGYFYVVQVYLLPKSQYNGIHPYTSFIPITIYIILRNLFMRARLYHIELFTALGKVTLESYISQFHIWMVTTGLNGSPKLLLRVVPEGYPMINFALTSIILCIVSFRLFATTNATRGFLIPHKASNYILRTNLLSAALFLSCLYGISFCIYLIASREA
ncbi:putative CAS1 domain-containing protein 1-like isoform X2 [Trypanosoma theileri]|uniref:Putative CAS1 domain-containing protein 1-like isoform X2 n=1 Tax=Trypanosoma theileri TaxID=67003 RepID=A0A1X0NN81_9TRYP|nr:putative CAS1 domain-containing protein 1-like isoform X2 [Trypanosoma theileri]ORC85569.1 putative CAS1 domain-containing protein 1-like isoform X2 [Trypanosoma theileri]